MARKKGLSFSRKKKKKISANFLREIIIWMFNIAIAIIFGIFIVVFFGMQVRVNGTAMEPTIENSETIFVNKILYLFKNPGKGDVIVFLPNGNEYSNYYVKRIVAIPGDTVQIIEGRLYVNGEMEEESFDKMEMAGIAENLIRVGSGEYFVLGDSRNSGEDSRSGNIGLVKEEFIEGKVWIHLGSENNTVGFIK